MKHELDSTTEKIYESNHAEIFEKTKALADSLLQLLFQTIPHNNRNFYIGEGEWHLCESPFVEQETVTLIYENKTQEKEITIEIVKSHNNGWNYYPCQYDPGCHENIRFKEMASALSSVLSYPSKFEKVI